MNLFPTRKNLLCTAAVLLLLAGPVVSATAQAPIKIGTLSLRDVFQGYHLTQQADEELKGRLAEVEKELKEMLEKYKKASEDFRKLSGSSADMTVSADERERRKKTAEGKLTELQEMEASLKQFRADADRRLGDQRMRMRDGLLKKIRELIVTKAKAGGFQLILDISAETADRTEVVLFSSDLPNLTEELLKSLNADAPAGWTPKVPAAAEERK